MFVSLEVMRYDEHAVASRHRKFVGKWKFGYYVIHLLNIRWVYALQLLDLAVSSNCSFIWYIKLRRIKVCFVVPRSSGSV